MKHPADGYPPHPFSEIFPINEGEPLWKLGERIREYGQREEIVLLDGKILDGRRRELACLREKVTPLYRKFGSRKSDGENALEFVYDVNFHRRHLTENQAALSAAKYATAKAGNAQTAQNEQSPTNKQAAEKFGVSEQKVRRAKVVVEHGTPKMQEAVAAGEVSVSDAAAVATKPARVQNAALDAVRNGQARTAKAAVEEKEEEDLLPAVETVDQIRLRLNKEIEAFCRKITSLVEAELPDDVWIRENNSREGIKRKFKDACEQLRCAKCSALCPRCDGTKLDEGKKCVPCRGTGRLPKFNLDQL